MMYMCICAFKRSFSHEPVLNSTQLNLKLGNCRKKLLYFLFLWGSTCLSSNPIPKSDAVQYLFSECAYLSVRESQVITDHCGLNQYPPWRDVNRIRERIGTTRSGKNTFFTAAANSK